MKSKCEHIMFNPDGTHRGPCGLPSAGGFKLCFRHLTMREQVPILKELADDLTLVIGKLLVEQNKQEKVVDELVNRVRQLEQKEEYRAENDRYGREGF